MNTRNFEEDQFDALNSFTLAKLKDEYFASHNQRFSESLPDFALLCGLFLLSTFLKVFCELLLK